MILWFVSFFQVFNQQATNQSGKMRYECELSGWEKTQIICNWLSSKRRLTLVQQILYKENIIFICTKKKVIDDLESVFVHVHTTYIYEIRK